MHRSFLFLKTPLFILLCLVSSGCATSPPTKFYLLNPLSAPHPETATIEDRQPVTIRVDAVVIPGYLDRYEIVTRVSENEIHLADLNQWGEPLRDNLTRVVALNLSRLLPENHFAVFPLKCPTSVDCQVSIEIVRMDGGLGGNVSLTAQWSVLRGKDGKIMDSRKFRFKESDIMPDYGALVSAQSRLVEALSREIADSIRARL